MAEWDYCGCCGRECKGEWCADCKAHLRQLTLRPGLGCALDNAPWERTYYAQFGEDCPYQETT
jgi:hypothetical protein